MDYIEGGDGADTIIGTERGDSAAQLDPYYHVTDYATAGYSRSNAAVNVNLTTRTATGDMRRVTGSPMSSISSDRTSMIRWSETGSPTGWKGVPVQTFLMAETTD